MSTSPWPQPSPLLLAEVVPAPVPSGLILGTWVTARVAADADRAVRPPCLSPLRLAPALLQHSPAWSSPLCSSFVWSCLSVCSVTTGVLAVHSEGSTLLWPSGFLWRSRLLPAWTAGRRSGVVALWPLPCDGFSCGAGAGLTGVFCLRGREGPGSGGSQPPSLWLCSRGSPLQRVACQPSPRCSSGEECSGLREGACGGERRREGRSPVWAVLACGLGIPGQASPWRS